jgi:Co/Zn/Cd efflux system component
MRSAWVCTRNDVLGNLAVPSRSLACLEQERAGPDIIVAVMVAALALQGAWIVVSQSRAELHISASHDIVMGA